MLEERGNPTKENGSISCSFHGIWLRLRHSQGRWMRTESSPGKPSQPFKGTLDLLNERSEELPLLHKQSQNPSGNTFLKVKPLISTSSSAVSTTLPLLRRMWDALVQQKFLLESQIRLEKSKRVEIGPSLGMPPQKQLCTSSHTEPKSCVSGGTIWHLNSPQSTPTPITNSLPSTEPSEGWWVEDSRLSSQTGTVSPIYTLHTSCQMEFKEDLVGGLD